jgi:phosphatidate cytidylyltransferase
MSEAIKPKSDLKVRTVSAIVMAGIAGGALWAGGYVFLAFSILIALCLLWEWWGLSNKIATSPISKSFWMLCGGVYLLSAISCLVTIRSGNTGLKSAAFCIMMVVSVDIGAYFAGRSIGGPKIAPSISPNKTWAGLIGGIISASIVAFVYYEKIDRDFEAPELQGFIIFLSLFIGTLIGIIAQSGDFLESWMKRKAGVKDSGSLIPGHGGLLDRVDGMIAVFFVLSLFALVIPTSFSQGKHTVTIDLPK